MKTNPNTYNTLTRVSWWKWLYLLYFLVVFDDLPQKLGVESLFTAVGNARLGPEGELGAQPLVLLASPRGRRKLRLGTAL